MALVFGILVSFCVGLTEYFGRRSTDVGGITGAGAAMQWWSLVATVAALLFVPSTFAWTDFLLGVISGIGISIGVSCYFGAMVRSSATVVAPTTAVLLSLIPFAFTVARGSRPSPAAIIGVGLCLGGLILITAGGGDTLRGVRIGLLWGGVGGIAYGLGLIAAIGASSESGMVPAVGQRFAGCVALAAGSIVTRQRLLPSRSIWLDVTLGGLAMGLTTIFYLLGAAEDPAITAVVSGLFPAFSVALGWVFFSDVVRRPQLAGIGLVLAGVMALAVG